MKCIRNDNGDLACEGTAWKNCSSRLLNKEFEWDKDGLSSADPILDLAVRIKRECGGSQSVRRRLHLIEKIQFENF